MVHLESPAIGKTIMELEIPKQALIVMIQRHDGTTINPSGATELMPGDRLLVIAETINVIRELKRIIGAKTEERKPKKRRFR